MDNNDQTTPSGIANTPRLIAVDDDPEMATLIADIGQQIGFEADASFSAEQFLSLWGKQRYDVIVLDLTMPDTDGFELLTLLAKRSCDAAILMVSGFDDVLLANASLFARAKGLKCIGSQSKPFHLTELQAQLQGAYDACAVSG